MKNFDLSYASNLKFSFFDINDLARVQLLSNRWSMYLYELPMPVFRHINIDFCQDLNRHHKLRFKRLMIEATGSVPSMFDQDLESIDQANDLNEDAIEIGPQWRKVKLQLLVKQIQEELYFLWKIATKRQIIDSIKLNLNNIDISDDDYAFYHVLKAL